MLGRHADHRELDPVQPDPGAENRRAGVVLAHPEIVAQNDHGIASLHLVLIGTEGAAQRRLHAQHSEEVARNKTSRISCAARCASRG